MTEYDYSPEAYNRFVATQNRIAKWVDTTERHRGEFQAPFGPGGQQQQRPPLESRSSRSTPAPSRHRNGHSSSRGHHRHQGRYDDSSSDSGSSDSREYGPGPGPMSMSSMPRGLPGTSGAYQHHHQQVYQPMQMQQQYASPHVQIYGAPGAAGQVQVYGGGSGMTSPVNAGGAPTPAIGGGVRPPMLALPSQTQIYPPPHQSHQQGHGHHHGQMHASYSYAGASSPPLYGYPNPSGGYPMGSPPIIVSAGNSSPARKSGSKSKTSGSSSRRSRSHQPTSSAGAGAAAALAAYYAGGAVGYPGGMGVGGYTSPPHTPGYQYPSYSGAMSGMSSPAATGGGSVSGGYFVPQQYPPMVPMMYRG